MPLHFLTADGEPDTAPSDAPLPHEELERWRRPYRPGPWRVAGAALLLLLASYMLLSTLIIAMAGTLAAAGVSVLVSALVIAYALRLLRVGVWVSTQGIRQVGLFMTVTLDWKDVAVVRTVQQPVKWLGTPRSVQGQALVVEPRGREALRTVLTDHNADFLARPEAFDRAADVVEGWAAEYHRP
ncbi:hypothetical protein CUT44_05405 [Streptomyces carminius]|uniref:Uncharacterized protein n=1 Tax=Streptomyces carminius TaxID=2665496 RepID=A0A2M8M4S7_9ACTN|nr:hypothetical protein [Streptomyces carminius]PJE99205.1 hypothetical protein CUT44_05405 [Streptomyces carminius]